MAKPEWGVKRQCASCGARFYDLNMDPAACPECGAVFTIETLVRGRGKRAAQVFEDKAVAVLDDVELVDDEEALPLDDEDEAAVVADDDEAAIEPALEEDGIEPDDDVLLEDDVDVDGDEALGEFGADEPGEEEDRR
jgi:uncharacterized protein (TIGR02300 family)